ncbi:MAG: MFS transporter [Actinobacteria bacterium]|nr:MFS transporter [Actinomycetota bacterium]
MLRPRILHPLRERDFRLWTIGAGISLLGDGIFLVAVAWQVFDLTGKPGLLGLVFAVWTLPNVALLLVGGVVSDRMDRRRVMVAADALRAAAIGTLGVLSVTGALRLWHVFALIGLMGVGDAFFNPASTALVPDLLAADDLVQANALGATMRPFMLRFLGPAAGGLLVAGVGAGWAFLADAGTFVVSAIAVWLITPRPAPSGGTAEASLRRFRREIGEGWAFVRRNPWCWATLVAALLSLLTFYGPLEVLLPYRLRFDLHENATSLGLIFSAGGVGAILGAVYLGTRGLPRRAVTFMYWCWGIGVLLIGVFGLMTEVWQAVLASFFMQMLFELGTVVWVTMMQTLVPRHLLGRVASLDWMVSIGLVPLSFALTGPAAEAFGARATLIGGGALAAVVTMVLLYVRGVRDPERTGALRPGNQPGGDAVVSAG